MLLRSKFCCVAWCSSCFINDLSRSHSHYSFFRCLVLIEDFDRSEDGDQGEIGLAIQEQRYEDLMQEDIYQTEKWMEQLVY